MPETERERFPKPEIAMEFLSKKINLTTDRWDDLKWGEHAHAFTVAHSIEADVVDKIHGLLNKAMADGEAFGTFKKNMLEMMKKEGWYGGAGHKADEKRYINWRIGVIYDTNMSTAYAAEHYRKQLEIADLRPVWVYHHDPAVSRPREEHLALDGKAFMSDDPFWDTYYPPNGWGCRCYVTTKSVSGAERDGVEIARSGDDETPPPMKDKDGNPVDWQKFGDPAWKYNVGREALAPNFSRYKNLPEETLKRVYAKYRQSMDGTRMTEGEFKTLLKRANEADYKPLNARYQVGNLDEKRFEAMRQAGVNDSKIMATDSVLWHGTGDKVAGQKVPEHLFDDLYKTIGEPEHIYEEKVRGKLYRVFHFVKDISTKGRIKVLLHLRNLKDSQTALEIRTVGYSDYRYGDGKHEKIW
jgi:SPP1 gp7 family putative phage head morphogenesis protein